MTIVVSHTPRKVGAQSRYINTVCEACMQKTRQEPPLKQAQHGPISSNMPVEKPVDGHVVSHTDPRGITHT